MKKWFLATLFSIALLIWFSGTIKNAFAENFTPVDKWLLQVQDTNNVSANTDTNVDLQKNFLKTIQIYMMGLAGIVSVAVFLYIGYTLFTAQGNEEEFKKAWKALIYAVIGLAVMPLAYIAVKIVTGFTL